MKKKKLPSQKELLNRVEKLKDLKKVQCSRGNWDYNEYMRGLANGIIIALTVLENKANAKYMNARKKN